jgi:hypothetical protein
MPVLDSLPINQKTAAAAEPSNGVGLQATVDLLDQPQTLIGDPREPLSMNRQRRPLMTRVVTRRGG